MSVLVSWSNQTSGPLLRGLYPNGLSHINFDSSVITDGTGGVYAGYYNGDPSSISDFGMTLFLMPKKQKRYRARLSPGEVIALLKDPGSPNKGSYAKIYRAAYPQGNKSEDDVALEFLEQAKNPYSKDGMIDVDDLEPALDYFLASPQNYIDQSDKDRVMQGWPI